MPDFPTLRSCTPFGYRPHGACAGYAAPSDDEAVDEQRYPDMAVMIACCEAMGLGPDCAELRIWRDTGRELLAETALPDLRPLAEKIRSFPDGEQRLIRLYFSLVVPAAAAADAGEFKIAAELYLERMRALEEEYTN